MPRGEMGHSPSFGRQKGVMPAGCSDLSKPILRLRELSRIALRANSIRDFLPAKRSRYGEQHENDYRP